LGSDPAAFYFIAETLLNPNLSCEFTIPLDEFVLALKRMLALRAGKNTRPNDFFECAATRIDMPFELMFLHPASRISPCMPTRWSVNRCWLYGATHV
jgi:hypothetical protein